MLMSCLVLSAFQLTKSTSNLNDVLYSGRPKAEEPHVKRTTKKKSEKIEYIVRVDLVRSQYYITTTTTTFFLSCPSFNASLFFFFFSFLLLVFWKWDAAEVNGKTLWYPSSFLAVVGCSQDKRRRVWRFAKSLSTFRSGSGRDSQLQRIRKTS